MPYERLRTAKKRAVGTKQVTKAVSQGKARVVFIARDAESHVTEPLWQLCRERGIEVIEVDSMKELGRACSIDVGSASAAILEE
ncbi:L7Ae/L30e/S12e/Gadd45 family ribosomal protein [Neomoorella thermoacetica]|uniref:Ribosome-associated protein L7Ae-like protein n=1 Tax=Neomoorella thermoacetica TaxID=1525 RepID=A0AAC9MW17_NEOTH|nr:ribosomal L7Ae/L30e/S12e/Gadd45 family protein [Moorella thermoacetica]AOQ25440.1 Ribosome-associated protein L7Ae-like protein [Moorella thermoacetica]APC09664.1 ribosome-associated protein L7Ae-like protein [Moorella thermoacetica]TYL13310.1 Ribosome-associated protein L7Ae-like protein [Moorella thermoacetica]